MASGWLELPAPLTGIWYEPARKLWHVYIEGRQAGVWTHGLAARRVLRRVINALAVIEEGEQQHPPLTPSADVPACRDEDPAQPATLAACYPDSPEYQHPEDDDDRGPLWTADTGDDAWW